jgi:hypothetical protein
MDIKTFLTIVKKSFKDWKKEKYSGFLKLLCALMNIKKVPAKYIMYAVVNQNFDFS